MSNYLPSVISRLRNLSFGMFLICVLLCASSLLVRAQSTSATLSGTVQDENGAVVPSAEITVFNPATALRRQVETSDEGFFTVVLLPPGTYTITARRSGFAPVEIRNVVLNVGDQKSLQIQLKAGDVNAQVTIDSTAEAITTDGSVGTVVNRQFVENIPMNGRSFQSLILLTPGVVTNSPQASAASGFSGEFSVNGQRTEANRYTEDGVSANNAPYPFGFGSSGTGGGLPTATATGTTQSLVSLDALQEFRVLSSSYSAEYGRSPGGQFSFITRSGTNDLHGSAFEYFRNDALDANNWFNNRSGFAKSKERQNDFGGTFGGPVVIPRLYRGHDRTFFFFSYEGLRLRQPLAATLSNVPSVDLRNNPLVSPVLQSALRSFPLPNGVNVSDGLAEYVFTDSVPSSVDSTSIRIDHNINNSQRFFFRYSYAPSSATVRSATVYTTTHYEPQLYTIGLTSTLSSRFTNEFRLGYSRNKGETADRPFTGDGAKPFDLNEAQGIDIKANPRALVLVGLFYGDFGPYVGVQFLSTPQNQWNVTDAATFIAGKHQFKFGVDYLRTSSELQRADPQVVAMFFSLADVLASQPSQIIVQRYGKSFPAFTNVGVFAQDDWRVSRRLMLSFGLRWDVSPPPSAWRGELPRVLSGSILQPSTLTLAPEGTPLWKTTYNNFAPRVGASYVFGSTDFQRVVRGGYGIFFDNGQNSRSHAFGNNPGSFYSTAYTGVSFPLASQLLDVSIANSLNPPFDSIYQFGDPAFPFKLPYSHQWNLTVEQMFHANQFVTISYVGSRGRRLLELQGLNLSAFNRNFPSVNVVRNGLTSSYDAFQAQYQRRLSRGLQAVASYTWSHSIDYGSQNANLPARRGDSDFDLRHNFSAAVTYDFPRAFKAGVAGALLDRWSLDGRFSARSAFPVTLNGRQLTDRATGQRYFGGLDLVPGMPLYVYGSNFPGGRRINPAAFKLPVGSQVGNAPRNFVRGFGATQFDAALHREFVLTERFRLQFRLEAFNLFNTPNFGLINSTFSTNPQSQFGKATAMLNGSLGGLSALYQQGGPRSVQLSLRLAF